MWSLLFFALLLFAYLFLFACILGTRAQTAKNCSVLFWRRCTTPSAASNFVFFKGKTGFGRAITGDGATILGTKFINFLCHEHGRGAMLCHLKDCSERLLEVGTVEATFIAHELIKAIRLILCNNISNININILTLTLLIPGWLDLPALRVSSPMAALTGRLARTWCKINSRGSFSCIACRTRRHYVSSTFFKSPR